MYNLVNSLPIELTRKIYEYDPTYKNILDHSLRLIDHCMEKCTCGGKITTITTPYFYGNFGNNHCLKHDMTGLKNFIGDDTPVNNYPNLSYCNSWERACDGVNAVVIMTEWNEFRGIDLKKLESLMVNPIILDTRNILSISELTKNDAKREPKGET